MASFPEQGSITTDQLLVWAQQNFRRTVLNHHSVVERHGKFYVSINQYRVFVEPRNPNIDYGSLGRGNAGGHGAARSEEWCTGHVEILDQTEPI
jgi:hypothetical protein